ncbi:surface-adhesin E family protein [Nostoc sp.]|uniref:surface-adhesin E family protein n=1 Tax=Nostoc sp. TaxID=1180 RepID=UPI002FF743A0
MLKKIAIAAITSTFIFVPTIVKAEWVFVDQNDKFASFVDRIIKVNGKPAFFWQKIIYKTISSDNIKSVIFHEAVSCDLMAFKNLTVVFYNDSGEVLTQEDNKEPLDWKYAIPGSEQEFILKRICK